MLPLLKIYCKFALLFLPKYFSADSIEWHIEGQTFSRSYGLAPRPPRSLQPLSPVSKLDRWRTRGPRKRDKLLTGGVRKEPNQTTAKNLVLYKTLNTLWISVAYISMVLYLVLILKWNDQLWVHNHALLLTLNVLVCTTFCKCYHFLL